MNLRRIVLPGFGTPTTFTVKEDSNLGVLVNGKMVTVNLKANQPTRIEFLKSLNAAA